MDWFKKAHKCPLAKDPYSPGHKWIPIAKQVTTNAEHVTMLLCGVCFHHINVSDVWEGVKEKDVETK